ncbi:MAG: hypothetical protein KDC05_02550 [Bacteroidales bacterium]|nr:hypothetical protein [Bacteroidales bacterium]
MKKIIVKTLPLFFVVIMLFVSTIVLGDNPPDPGGGPTGDPVGGGSPIGGGLFILMTMAVAYGTKKIHNLRKN